VVRLLPGADWARGDILILTETFATTPIAVPGFYAHHSLAQKGRRGRPSGGVAILVAPTIQDMRLIARGLNYVIVASPGLCIIGAYFSPTVPTAEMLDRLGEMLTLVPAEVPVLLAGDFNARIDMVPWPLRSIGLMDCMATNGLWLCSEPSPFTYESHQGSSTVDLVATSLPVGAISAPVALRSHSMRQLRKHIPVRCLVRINAPDSSALQPLPKLSKWVDQSCLAEALTALTSRNDWRELTIGQAISGVVEALIQAIPMAPEVCRSSKPWFDGTCFRARAVLEQARLLFEIQPVMRRLYMEHKGRYKQALVAARLRWQRRQEAKLLAAAEAQPFRYERASSSRAVCPIPAEQMVAHFRDIAGGVSSAPTGPPPQVQAPLSDDLLYWSARLNDPFSQEEVDEALQALPCGKAEGPDRLRYEHLKSSPQLTAILTEIFNRCLAEARFPEEWAECLMILIPKGKGDLSDPEAWRGISKKAVMGKVFSSLLARRLLRLLSNCNLLPPRQHGFLPGRSTTSAIRGLMDYLNAHMRVARVPVYALFVDFKAAFNTASRTAIINTLAELGVSGPFLDLINAMMAPNIVKLFDGLVLLPGFSQDTGLPQGDTISSLLFVILLMELPHHVKSGAPSVEVELYADDLLLLALRLGLLKEAAILARDFAASKGLEINWTKTKVMKFRRGGKLSSSDILVIDSMEVPFVPAFCYLGVTFTVTAATFSRHVQDRKARAITAACLLPPLPPLSLATAIDLFNIKIAPMATYGLTVCWEFLKVSDFRAIDGVLMTFLKRAMGVSRFAKSRLVLLLSETTLTTERLAAAHGLPHTPNYLLYLDEWRVKLQEIDPEFLGTSAMMDRSWVAPNAGHRSAVCRLAVHGFHHVFCAVQGFHDASVTCICRFCGCRCDRYHSQTCQASPFHSLSQLAAAH
jgi:hypothetical protein